MDTINRHGCCQRHVAAHLKLIAQKIFESYDVSLCAGFGTARHPARSPQHEPDRRADPPVAGVPVSFPERRAAAGPPLARCNVRNIYLWIPIADRSFIHLVDGYTENS